MPTSAVLEPGQPAPAFDLGGADGPISLSDFAGMRLVLYFYPKDDTTGCTAEALDFSALRLHFEAVNAKVLGVSPDSAVSHARFIAKHGLKLSLGSDETKYASQAYGVWQEKSMYGRKYMGVVRSTFLIDGEGRIARVWRNVKTAGHAAQVLDAVIALTPPAAA